MQNLRSICQLRVVLAAAALTGVAAPAHPQDTLAGDPRLQYPQTIRASGRTFEALLRDLSARTGITFSAGPEVASGKVILYAYNRPLVDSLREVARFFRFTWVRSGDPARPSYTLTQTAEQKREETLIRESAIRAAANTIHREVRQCAIASAMKEETGKQRIKTIMAVLQVTPGGPAADDLRTELNVLNLWQLEPRRVRILAKLFGGKSVEDLTALLHKSRTKHAYPPLPRLDPLPPDIAAEVDALLPAAAPPIPGAEVRRSAQITCYGSRYPAPAIRGTIRSTTSEGTSTSIRTTPFQLPLPRSTVSEDDAPTPIGLTGLAALRQPVTFSIESAEPAPENSGRLAPTATSAAIRVLQDCQSFDVISDAFYTTGLVDARVENLPLADAIHRLCRQTGHTWTVHGGFVHIRSKRYEWDRAMELPVSKLAHWAGNRPAARGMLDLLAEIASLDEDRANAIITTLERAHILEDLSGVSAARGHLLLWSKLSDEMRSAALSPEGLPYRALSPDLKQAFEEASTIGYAPEGFASSNEVDPWYSGELAEASLYVRIDGQEVWRYRDEHICALAPGTRQQAYERIRQSVRGLQPDALQGGSSGLVRFRYGAPQTSKKFGKVNLPIRWNWPGA